MTADEPTAASPAVAGSEGEGALWTASARPSASPAAVNNAPTGFGTVRQNIDERPKPNYSIHATSPVPYAVAALTALIAAIGVVRWAIEDVGSRSTAGFTDTWWTAITVFVTQTQVYSVVGTDRVRLWWAFAGLVVAGLAVVLWVRRIGQNARADVGVFGSLLVLAAVPAWFTLPLTIAPSASAESISVVRLRITLALVVLLGQGLFARWAFTHKIWRAGRLPLEQVAYVLWLPLLTAGTWLYGAALWTSISVDEHGRGHSKWRPTEAIARAELWTVRGTGLMVFVLVVLVTVRQHLGVRADRALAKEWSLS